MLKSSHVILMLGIVLGSGASSAAQVSIGIAVPGVSIGINLPSYPELDVVPGYPVYYAPQVDANYFFYDGTYWLYQDDNWYASSWYNGPWDLVDPMVVPAFVLRVPVRYYRHPPAYFRSWGYDAPPHWDERWGRDWEQRRSGWDRWGRGGVVPAPAPLPVYQRQYSGDRYPWQVEQQRELNRQNYHYQPNQPVMRQPYRWQRLQGGPGPDQQRPQGVPRQTNPWLQGPQRYNPPPVQQGAPYAPHAQPPQQGVGIVQRSGPPQEAAQPRQQMPGPQDRNERHQNKDAAHEPGKDGQREDRGRDHNEYER